MAATTLDPFAAASAMLDALRAREISAVELLDLHLARIARYNPALNAIVTSDFERARQAAIAADEAYAQGDRRALLGLPVTIKDTIDVAGLPGTAGVVADRIPARDAPVAARVRAAGAILIGKTNVPPYAGDWQAVNPLFGRTNNPWDASRSPGGSTGGGAAVAAGLTLLEFGSDIGGSIRIPAAFCGVYGHKPSETAVPRSGHFPGSPLPNTATALAVMGPLARDAGDLELALDCIAGPDVGEDTAWQLHLPPTRCERLSEFRVAILPPLPWLPVDSEIQAAQEAFAEMLRHAGCRVETVAPERFADFHEQYELYRKLLFVMMNIGAPEEQRRRAADTLRQSGDRFGEASAAGALASASDYILWNGQREGVRAEWRAFFCDWDVAVAPANIVVAFKHTDEPFSQRRLVIDGTQVPYSWQSAYPAIATLSGLPATAFPVGATSVGLPIGLQALGPYLEDRTPIHFANLATREFGGFRRPPGYN
jgi:amidase